MSSIPERLPAESDAQRGELVQRCDELFEQALFMKDALGYRVDKGIRTEYMAVHDATTGDSVYLYRDDITTKYAAAYPYRITEELDGYDIDSGEPHAVTIQCFIDRFGNMTMPLRVGEAGLLVSTPKGLADRYADLIRTGTPAELVD